MKQKSRYSKLYAILALLALLFLLCINVTSAYFSAQKRLEETSSMVDLSAAWMCTHDDGSKILSATNNIVEVEPSTGTITRGQFFGFNIVDGDTKINDCTLGFNVSGCPAYVRFWVTAYPIVGENVVTDINYGKYFTLDVGTAAIMELKENPDNLEDEENEIYETNNIYYLKQAVGAYVGSGSRGVISQMKLNEDAPASVMGKTFQIRIHFEAVQAANQAYKTVFNDWKSYVTWP